MRTQKEDCDPGKHVQVIETVVRETCDATGMSVDNDLGWFFQISSIIDDNPSIQPEFGQSRFKNSCAKSTIPNGKHSSFDGKNVGDGFGVMSKFECAFHQERFEIRQAVFAHVDLFHPAGGGADQDAFGKAVPTHAMQRHVKLHRLCDFEILFHKVGKHKAVHGAGIQDFAFWSTFGECGQNLMTLLSRLFRTRKSVQLPSLHDVCASWLGGFLAECRNSKFEPDHLPRLCQGELGGNRCVLREMVIP
jgi:hypothetical protein